MLNILIRLSTQALTKVSHSAPISSVFVDIQGVVQIVTADSIFSGITTFAKLPWVQCLSKDKDESFDIAFLGAPFVR